MGRKRRVGLVYVDSNCVHRVQHGKWHLGKHGHAKSQRPTTKTYSRFFCGRSSWLMRNVNFWDHVFCLTKVYFFEIFSFGTKVKLESKTKYRRFSIRCVLYTIFSKNAKPLTFDSLFESDRNVFEKMKNIRSFPGHFPSAVFCTRFSEKVRSEWQVISKNVRAR